MKTLNYPILRLTPCAKYWVVAEEYKVTIYGEEHVVPAGFITDFASVGRFGTFIFGSKIKHSIGALLHDWYYFSHYRAKKQADILFKRTMIQEGNSRFKVNVFYYSVRCLGGRYYNERPEDKLEEHVNCEYYTICMGRQND